MPADPPRDTPNDPRIRASEPVRDRDEERNRFSGRAARYARVGAGVGGIAAKMIGSRAFGVEIDRSRNAADLARALGGLKGPIMKVAQLLATIPDVLPPEYTAELAQLQSDAPPMGWAFVKRRMTAELGAGWQKRFAEFEHEPAAAASLGQVHRARAEDGTLLACKLQYPEMASAVEADLGQLGMIFALHRRMDPAIDTREMAEEIAARVREELDYEREAGHMALYGAILADEPRVRVPELRPELSTRRLLTMNWLQGERLLAYKDHSLEERNFIASAMFRAWWHPFSHFAVIHGDPHLGNYTVFEEDGRPGGINLLDYGCVRIFPPGFVEGVIELYRGLQEDDRARIVAAYETWGFRGLSNELIDILNIWARFIYGPLLEDRVRAIADGVSPAQYGRGEAYRVHQALKEKGPVTVPREFVFMDRAAIGLGGVFLHLRAEMNFYRLFNEEIEGFDYQQVAERQASAIKAAGLPAQEFGSNRDKRH
ncbi:AarF/ABC1/UbiB kinase family protein [Afifella sp. IM 167]|uniref:ABC1 kinase family protein n=1 Tax=Afifella sp. IM 167 TaxID=2033586 RepID=UPI001CCCD523|nr:AarF/ABC1/UbiB kinase family protein [Afifella sp. IM 167]MBZ8135330.1 ABC transporter ATP-binding protein [Afifella sp. IM 167]